jgi:hypothetical protein
VQQTSLWSHSHRRAVPGIHRESGTHPIVGPTTRCPGIIPRLLYPGFSLYQPPFPFLIFPPNKPNYAWYRHGILRRKCIIQFLAASIYKKTNTLKRQFITSIHTNLTKFITPTPQAEYGMMGPAAASKIHPDYPFRWMQPGYFHIILPSQKMQ